MKNINQELSYLNLKDVMPIHSEDAVSLPNRYDESFPKNFMNQSNKVMEKFLDNYLCEIEESKNKSVSTLILNQYRKYHYSADIRITDNFLKRNMEYNSPHSLFGIIASSKIAAGIPGADLVTATGGTDVGSFGNNNFQAFVLPSGNVTDLYDQISMDIAVSSGNVKFACYDDSTGPNNLYEQTGSIASFTGYTWQSLTEFALATTVNWACFNNTVTAMHPKSTTGSSGDRQFAAETFATSFTTPAPGGRTSGADVANMKIGHT